MADEPINYALNLDQERPSQPAEYHVMVLLVDDQAMVCEAVRRALANQTDIDFHYCADAREALTVANQIKPTVILQDLVMPGVDGLTLVNQFRANPATKDTPIKNGMSEKYFRGARHHCLNKYNPLADRIVTRTRMTASKSPLMNIFSTRIFFLEILGRHL